MTAARLIAAQSVRLILRERTAASVAALFIGMVLISSWLGWQATATVNRIYTDAAAFLAGSGKPVPSNPVLDRSPLILLRNLPVYVALIGALAAIVIGNRLVALDRRAGVLPLIGSRPGGRYDYASGKIAALGVQIAGLTGVAAVVSVMTLQSLPAVSISGAQWVSIAGYFGLSAAYMLTFGLLALAAAAWSRSGSVGLLIAVTVWLAVTFILPALTLNLTPTAALNPISALAAPPGTAFFGWTGWLLGPLSLAENYGSVSARLLDFRPADWAGRSVIPALPALLGTLLAAGAAAVAALAALTPADEDYDA